MKPKCANCRGLFQEKNEELRQSYYNTNLYCNHCFEEADIADQIYVTEQFEFNNENRNS